MPKKINITKRLSKKHKSDYEPQSYISTLDVSEQRNSVSEDSLKVWSELPVKIRQDPSLAAFQTEHDRIHGISTDNDSENPDVENDGANEIVSGHDEKTKETEFFTLAVSGDAVDNGSVGKKTSVASTQVVNQPEKYRNYAKMVSLLVIWLIMTSILATTNERMSEGNQVVVPVIGAKGCNTLMKKRA